MAQPLIDRLPAAPCVSWAPAANGRLRLKRAAAFAAVYLIWGSTYLAIRFAIESLPALTMAGMRFLVAGGLLVGWALLRGARRPGLREWRAATLVGLLLFLVGNGGVVWAEKELASGLAALLVATEPLWVAVWLAVPRGRRFLDGRTLLALFGGFLGAALLAGSGGRLGGAEIHLPSVLALVLAAAGWAAGSLYARRAPLPESTILATGMQMVTGGALLLSAGLLGGEMRGFSVEAVEMRSLVAWAYLVLFGSIVAFSAYTWLVRNVRPILVSTYAYVNPLVAVVLGWLLAGEPVGPRAVIAAVLILSSLALLSRSS